MLQHRPIIRLMGLRPTGDFGPWTFYTSKRATPVFFLRAPPTEPASDRQRYWRGRFTTAAMAWNALEDSARENWNLAADRGRLRITGYDLWIWYQIRRDPGPLRTLERITGATLLPS